MNRREFNGGLAAAALYASMGKATAGLLPGNGSELSMTELQQQFLELQRDFKKTSIFVTHDVREALFLGTRIALLDQGRLVGVYAPAEFLKASEPEIHAFAASLEFGGADEGVQ